MASGYMFSHYWPGDGVAGGGGETIWNYPQWQGPIVMGMGMVPVIIDPTWIAMKWERFLRWLPARIWVFIYCLKILFSPKLEDALYTVIGIAHDPSTRNLDTWTHINRLTVSNPKWGENMYRALAARVEFGSTDPEDALLLELAYLAFKRKRRK